MDMQNLYIIEHTEGIQEILNNLAIFDQIYKKSNRSKLQFIFSSKLRFEIAQKIKIAKFI
ncbi:unnamed protein product [Paramecium sonneborni]|uniref:Uncharacterized protein n=1 Tax=Paramecium sonneborni TaxID=65129 RepID=A0A8S1LQE7_9CILI|nr:unnamed protein product [Paramecium sonneborni]